VVEKFQDFQHTGYSVAMIIEFIYFLNGSFLRNLLIFMWLQDCNVIT